MQPPRCAHRWERHVAGAARCQVTHCAPAPCCAHTRPVSHPQERQGSCPGCRGSAASCAGSAGLLLRTQGVCGPPLPPGEEATHPLPSLKMAVRLCCVEEIIFQTQEKRCALFVGGTSQGNTVERAVGRFLMGPRGAREHWQ